MRTVTSVSHVLFAQWAGRQDICLLSACGGAFFFFFLMIRPPPRSPLFPTTTLSRSGSAAAGNPPGPGGRPWNDADPAVVLEHGGPHVLDVGDAAAAERCVQILERDALSIQILLEDAAVVDEERRLRLEQMAQPLRAERHLDDGVVQRQNHDRTEESPAERVVGADDRVLDHVRDDEEQGEVEGGELADLPLPREPECRQHEEVDDDRPQNLLRDADIGLPYARHCASFGLSASGLDPPARVLDPGSTTPGDNWA